MKGSRIENRELINVYCCAPYHSLKLVIRLLQYYKWSEGHVSRLNRLSRLISKLGRYYRRARGHGQNFTSYVTNKFGKNQTGGLMKARIHGTVAILLFIMAFLVGGVVVFRDSLVFGVIYSVVIVIFFTVIPALYCAKCPCRDKCMHVILGPISKIFRPRLDETPYTVMDVVLTLVTAAAAVALPQPWLIKDIPMLIFYWAAVGVAAGEILLFVCKGCGNEKCPMKKR